jgi:hypothetical protein
LPYYGCGPVDQWKNDASIKLLQNVEDKGEDGSTISDEMGWSAYLFATRKGSFVIFGKIWRSAT